MNQPRRATRREFFRGRATGEAKPDNVDGAAEEQLDHGGGSRDDASGGEQAASGDEATASSLDADSYLVSVCRRAMACEFAVYLNPTAPSDAMRSRATRAALDALDLVDCLEDQLTVYRDTSELIEVNRRAAFAPVAVESGLFALLQLAQRVFATTDGAFDVTSGPLSQIWGFSRRAGRMPSKAEIDAALSRVGCQFVALDEDHQTVSFCKAGVELNVNGIGKGYALDRAGDVLTESGVADFLIHGGQSSVLARGSDATNGRGWTVGLRHPLRPRQRLAEFYLSDRALATSGSGTQFFHFQGRRFGHVLDPRSGRPAEGVLSATVLAPTAAEADALSTAFYVLGPSRAGEICGERPDLAMVLVVPGERSGTIEMHTAGLKDGDWQRLPAT